MNAEEFYNEFKNALKHFGLKWNQMDQMHVGIRDQYIVFSHGNKFIYVLLEG